ncbi:hypothetical protein SLEP1_g58003 [Rubroshorea leprosula]|uniref:DUF4219 domain-containing protein n=1 Tax=Rubroshorea leprosula TaxID=152421 RepID=A0AAV5MNB0_9ROSI|nr:hypothetical protein SLEP1_g58003 [Rubroshorea leprosula]
MAQFQASQPLGGLSTTKPPFFDGTNYNYWKNRMKVFMVANVPKAWIVTMKGPYVPMKVVGESEMPKEEVEWNDEDLVKIMINNQVINMLQCVLNPTEFHRVSGCHTAKEMWDMLEVTYEGTSQVKESKINRLIYMYELFKMKPKESIQDMYTRLNDIVTNLKALGKVYPSQEVVRKVLRSLPKNWEAKKIAIEESKDLSTLKIEDLIGKLMTYEIEVQVDGGVEVVEKKKKNVTFKASNQKEESEDDAKGLEVKGNKWVILTPVVKLKKKFSPRNICAVLAIPEGGDDEFQDVNHALVRARIAPNCTENQIKVGSLLPENRALQWIISHIIAQRKGSKSFVLVSDLPWFDYLFNGKRVNLGRFIFWSLIKNYSSNIGLPHGALITRLVKRNNIDLEPFKHGRIKAGTILTKASFEKMQVVFRNGSWMKKGDQAMEQQADEEEESRLKNIIASSGKQKCRESAADFVELALRARNSIAVLARAENGSRAGSNFIAGYEGAFNTQRSTLLKNI